jgi:tRNA-splicing ligase RtcB
MRVLSTEKIPIKSWCPEIEPEALLQAKNLANHPKAFHHVALMPDCHTGMGMPIGGVVALKNAISPNMVGVDIGCGMVACKLSFTEKPDTDIIKKIFGEIRQIIPVGFTHHERKQEWDVGVPDAVIAVDYGLVDDALYSLGTLGGGNHFLELQYGDDGHIWLMIHSGSRNLGYKIANHYDKVARYLCAKWASSVSDDLAFLPLASQGGHDYREAMEFALAFALENRSRMMQHFQSVACGFLACTVEKTINIHHNYAAMENHFGENVMVHRKGATKATETTVGIIPGSMGTKSYIVTGKGNPESFMSCSHGAGRVMSRSEFNKTHSVEECNKAMEGIVYGRWGHDRKGRVDLSEAPQAYKDIGDVMANQVDLVTPIVELTPLGVMKG